MLIINILPFVITHDGTIGIAEGGTFASFAWCLNQEAFESISGFKFDWIAADGNLYIDDKSVFFRPTEEQVYGMSEKLKAIAVERGLVKL